MARISNFVMLLALVATHQAQAEKFVPDLVRAIQNENKPKIDVPIAVETNNCKVIENAINNNPDFNLNSFTVKCLNRKGGVILTLPEIDNLKAPNQQDQDRFNKILQTIGETAQQSGVQDVKIIVGKDFDEKDKIILHKNDIQNTQNYSIQAWQKHDNRPAPAPTPAAEPVVANTANPTPTDLPPPPPPSM